MGDNNPNLPNKYLGTNKYITYFVTRSRGPTGADYRQPETGTLYSIGTVWQVGKNPSNGIEGDLWMLSKIVANVGYWVKLISGVLPSAGILTLSDTIGTLVYPSPSSNVQLVGTSGQINVLADAANNRIIFSLPGGGGSVDSISVQAITAPGVNPVLPTALGLVTVAGAVVANHAVPLETRSRALNTYNIEVQQAGSAASSTANLSGVSHFSTANFLVDANGFVTLNGATVGQTITGQSGGALSPVAGNWNIFGLGEMTTSGSGNTLSILQPRNNHIIVDPTLNYGTHQTIAAAVAAASSGDTIFIRPGTYTENITITKNLVFFGYGGPARNLADYDVKINGKFTCATASTRTTFCNIALTVNGSNIAEASAGDVSISFSGCRLDVASQVGFLVTGSQANLYFTNCYITLGSGGSVYNCSNSSSLWFRNCWTLDVTGTSATSLNTGSLVVIQGCRFQWPMSSAAGGFYDIQNSVFGTNVVPFNNITYLTLAGGGTSYIYNSSMASGTASSVSIGTTCTLQIANSEFNSSNTNVLTGAGILRYAGIVFTGTSVGHNVTTETAMTVFG